MWILLLLAVIVFCIITIFREENGDSTLICGELAACLLLGAVFILLLILGCNFFVALIIDAIFIFAVAWIADMFPFSSGSGKGTSSSSTSFFPSNSGTMTIASSVYRQPSERRYSTCSFSNGQIYHDFQSLGTRTIGYYVKEDESELLPGQKACWNVYEADHFLCGQVRQNSNNVIYLDISLQGTYERHKSNIERSDLANRCTVRPPSPMVMICGYASGTIIRDIGTDDMIATYTGDIIGAAAAFICSIIQFQPDSKYYDFITNYTHQNNLISK